MPVRLTDDDIIQRHDITQLRLQQTPPVESEESQESADKNGSSVSISRKQRIKSVFTCSKLNKVDVCR